MIVMLWTAAVLANNLGVVGRTWPIAEEDALTEIEARSRQVDWNKALDRRRSRRSRGRRTGSAAACEAGSGISR